MRSRYIIWLAVAALDLAAIGVEFAGAEEPANAEDAILQTSASSVTQTPHQVVERALGFLERDAAQWRADYSCVSCHQGAMTTWALSEAKQQGYLVDPRTLEETVWQTKMSIVSRFSKPRE